MHNRKLILPISPNFSLESKIVEVLGGIRGVEDERLFETEVGARMDAIEEIRSSEVMSEPEEYEMGKEVTRRKRRNNHFGCEIYLYK